MIVHGAKSTCFVRSIYLHVSAVFITKQKSLGWSKTSKRKKNIRVRRIHWEKRPIKHTPSFQLEFVSIVGSTSVALCFRFYGAQVRLHMTFQGHNQKSSRICDQLVANFEPCFTEGGGPQVGEVTCNGLPHQTCKRDHIKMRDKMERRVTPPKRVKSPIWGTLPPCKQTLNKCLRQFMPTVAA